MTEHIIVTHAFGSKNDWAFIPKDIFDEKFDIIPPTTKLDVAHCEFKTEYADEFEAVIISHYFCEARSSYGYGDYTKRPMKIVGIYPHK